MKWILGAAIVLTFFFATLAQAAKQPQSCSAFRPDRHQEYVHCPSDVFIRHASGIEDWNITDGETVTLVGRRLPPNQDVFFGVACQGAAQEPARSDANGVAVFSGCVAVVDYAPGAMNCAFIYYGTVTAAYHELTPVP